MYSYNNYNYEDKDWCAYGNDPDHGYGVGYGNGHDEAYGYGNGHDEAYGYENGYYYNEY
jgi:hypothetical protein